MEPGRLWIAGLRADELPLDAIDGWSLALDEEIPADATAALVADAATAATLMRTRPDVARVRVCDADEARNGVVRGADAHEYLTRPLTASAIRNALGQAHMVHALLSDHTLRQLVGDLGALPALPGTYQALCAVLVDDRSTLRDAARVIERDVAVAGRILRLVNSALYALPRRVGSLDQAVGLLGLQVVRDLVLAVEVFGELQPERPLPGVSLARMQDQAHAVATLARVLAPRGDADLAYTAGLLGQLGRMFLMARASERYIACLYLTQADVPLDEAEQEVFGVRSRDLGAWLLALWGLPWEVVDAVRTSDAVPVPDGGPLPLVGAVHLAALFVEEAMAAEDDEPLVVVTREMVAPWGLERRVPMMRQMARSLVRGLAEPPRQHAPDVRRRAEPIAARA